MARTALISRASIIAALSASSACAANSGAAGECDFTLPSVADWNTYDEGAFTLQLPPDFTRVAVQGIDSQVGRWEAAGKWVSYDLGAYSNPLEPNEVTSFPGLQVCQESDGRGAPRIIRYTPTEGGYAIGAHWPSAGDVVAGMPQSLTIEGVVERPEDQGELMAIIRSVQIGQGAADGGDSAAGAPSGGQPGDTPDTGYRAAGNEPFWSLTFGESTMDFFSLGGGDTTSAARPDPERLPSGWRFTTTANGGPYVVEVEERLCNDSMSGRPFPHTVSVTVNGQTFSGCGGDTATLLTGDEWRVTTLEGTDVSGPDAPTLSFGGDGFLTGTGGCNRYRASYEITGEGIELGPAVATRMACVEPELNTQEISFFALLEQVTRFDIADDGSLQLYALDEPVIVARR